MIFDAASDGTHIILAMLIVGLDLPGRDRDRRADAVGEPPPQGAQAGLLLAARVAPPADLREWIALLEREGELVRIAAEVDPHLEVTEIVDRTVKAGGPALLFERPKGSAHPLLVNQFGTERRMCLAFGVSSLDDVGAKLADVLEMQPPSGLVDKLRGLKQLKSIADSLPNTRPQGRLPGDRPPRATTSTSARYRSRRAGRSTRRRSSRCRP